MQESDRSTLPPTASGILLFFAVVFANWGLILISSQFGLGENFLLIVTPAAALLLTAAWARVLRCDPKETFLLRLPTLADLLMAFPLAISFVILNDQISSLVQEVFPLPPGFEEGLREMLRAETASDWVLKIATIGFGAAISEELLVRGFIQSALLRGTGRTVAVVSSAFLFALMHFIPLPSFAVAGLVLGVTALATRSILVPIIIHFVNNVSALALVNLTDLETLGDPLWIPPTILVPATAIFILTMGFYLRRLALVEAPPAAAPPHEEPEIEPLVVPHEPRSLQEELATVPESKRRLGWLVVIAAVLVGMSVLLGLFAYSLYFINPRAAHAAIIEALEQEATRQLAPEASDRREDLDTGFTALRELNESGSLEWSELFRILAAYADVSADGTIDSAEVDSVLAIVRDVVEAAAVPRPL